MLSASPASAHARLDSSTPSPSAVLEMSPNDISLDFSEPVSRLDDSIQLFDEQQRRVDIPDSISPVSDRIEVRGLPKLDTGLYLVVWRAMSEDGHLAEGAFTFQVGVGSSSVNADVLLAGVESSQIAPTGLGVVRYGARAATYLGLCAVLGTLVLAVFAGARRVRPIIGVGWCAATAGTAVQFLAQSVTVSGDGWGGLVAIDSWTNVVSTRLGQGLVTRLALLGLLLGLLITAHRRRTSASSGSGAMETTWWRSSTAVVGGGIIVTFAATGHPSASSPAVLAASVDAVHLGAVVVWLGGLFAIVRRGTNIDVVRSFSRLASWAMPIAFVSGTWQAWHLLEDPSDITANDWGRSLVVKTVVVGLAATLALVARWVVQSADTSSLRRLVGIEVIAAIAIIAATSVLVASPPRVTATPDVVSLSLAQDDIIANVTVTPGGVGRNEIHVTITTPGGTLDPIDALEIRVTEGGGDLPPVTVDVTPLGPNHFLGTVAILRAGPWNFEFLVEVSPSRVVRLSTTIDI